MNLDLSVIIVSYNTRDLLRECLQSAFRSLSYSALRSEVWVVDNNSPDGSAAMVAEDFPQVRLIANRDNCGFAAANNQALHLCAGRYTMLLNPDTIVLDDAPAQLVGFMDGHPHAAVVGGTLLNPDGTFQHSSFHFPTPLMSFLDFFPLNHRVVDSSLNGRYPRARYSGPPFEIDHPLGACFMVRRAAMEEIGYLDERFHIYCEEIDWCLRFKGAGWRIYCVPGAKVIHYGAQSTRQFRGPMLVALHRSRRQLSRKHHGPIERCLSHQVVRLGAAVELLRAWRAAQRGQLTANEYRERINAYTAIFRL